MFCIINLRKWQKRKLTGSIGNDYVQLQTRAGLIFGQIMANVIIPLYVYRSPF